MYRVALVTASLMLLPLSTARAQVQRVWLTHRSADPGKLVVSWTTAEPGPSVVRYGTTAR